MTQDTSEEKTFPTQILIILVVIIGLGAVLVLPNLFQSSPPTSRLLTTLPECDLSSASCNATDDQQLINLEIKTDQISSAKAMLFEVELENVDANQVMLDLKGKEMYMGINQVQMEKLPGKNRWQGEVTLGVCATGEMTWVTSVLAEKDGKITQADFEFNAK